MVTVSHFALCVIIAISASLCEGYKILCKKHECRILSKRETTSKDFNSNSYSGRINGTNNEIDCEDGYYPDGQGICRKIINIYRPPPYYDFKEGPERRNHIHFPCKDDYRPDDNGICRKIEKTHPSPRFNYPLEPLNYVPKEGSIDGTNNEIDCEDGYYPDGQGICRKIINIYRPPPYYDFTEGPERRNVDIPCKAGYRLDDNGICRKIVITHRSLRFNYPLEPLNYVPKGGYNDVKPICKFGYYLDENGNCEFDYFNDIRLVAGRCDSRRGYYPDLNGECKKYH